MGAKIIIYLKTEAENASELALMVLVFRINELFFQNKITFFAQNNHHTNIFLIFARIL